MSFTGRLAAAAARAYGLFGAISAAVDPYFQYVTALLHGDGTNGAQNNTFLDSSTNNFTITRNGNTTQGSFSPFSQKGWSAYLGGAGNYFQTPASSESTIIGTLSSTCNLTIECWIYPTAYNSSANFPGLIGDMLATIENNAWSWGITNTGTLMIYWNISGSQYRANTSTTVALNQWTHIALNIASGAITMYINGASQTLSGTTTMGTPTSLNNYLTIGQWNNGSGGTGGVSNGLYTGYISNLRIIKASTYTSSFTPSTTPLTAIANTSFLTFQSNRYIDNSSNAITITSFGTPSVQPISPFYATTAYSTASVGGSGYFDGSGDYLSIANQSAFNLGTNNFCIDGWFYPTTTNATQLVFNKWGTVSDTQSMFQIGRISSTFYAQLKTSGGYVTLSTSTWIPNAWNHFAVVRSGSTISAYLNGARFGTDTTNPTLNTGTDTMTVGSKQAQDYFTGYITDCRIVNGSAIYDPTQTTITVPTSPATAVTNTAFLSSSTNGGIYDNAAAADYETVGDAQVSTAVVKYGTGSMKFDGVGDYLVTAAKPTMTLGTGDFTVEFWMYAGASQPSTRTPILSFGNGFTTNVWAIQLNNTSPSVVNQINVWAYNLNSAAVWLQGGPTIAASTWYHVAVCRTGSVFKLFVNGTQAATATSSASIDGDSTTLQWQVAYNSPDYFNGYIDDIRITKGVGRYQYNFTPPTAAFPNIGGTVTLTADPYYNYTTLLLPGNGTNGAQNNTFLDSSTNAFTITRNGNTTQGNFSPFSQTGWGNYFSGSSQYLSLTGGVTNAGTGDFTLEFWVYYTGDYSNYNFVFDSRTSGGSYLDGFNVATNITNGYWYAGFATQDLLTSIPAAKNQWSHIAVTRSGTTMRFFVNGTLAGSYTTSNNLTSTTNYIGTYYNANNYYFPGYISNLRAIKGTALYTSNFTPSTAPLTAVSGTSLLTCQSNRFVDNSANAFALTVTGSPSIQAFSPFAPTAAWSATTNGGSGYFDGSGDYLTLPSGSAFQFGTGDFTVEAWVNTSTTGGKYIIDARNSGQTGTWALGMDLNATGTNNSLGWWTGSSLIQPGTELVKNAWNHCVYVRSGTTYAMFLNGTRIGTGTDSTNYSVSPTTSYIGCYWGLSAYMTGYMADIRTVKGTAVYSVASSTLTVPTAPLTAIANTQLLLSATNGGIVDATAKNDLETIGNAQISTTQSKFGGSSMAFDGTGDWLSSPDGQNYNLGSADFTIEAWVYVNNLTNPYGVFGKRTDTGTQYRWLLSSVNSSSGTLNVQLTTTGSSWAINTNTTSAITASSWNHIAWVRYGSDFSVYVNGIKNTLSSSLSGSVYNGTEALIIGACGTTGAYVYSMNGYIDDLRITKGIARYTSNFTPPTSAFLTQ